MGEFNKPTMLLLYSFFTDLLIAMFDHFENGHFVAQNVEKCSEIQKKLCKISNVQWLYANWNLLEGTG